MHMPRGVPTDRNLFHRQSYTFCVAALCPGSEWIYRAADHRCYTSNGAASTTQAASTALCNAKGGSLIEGFDQEQLNFAKSFFHLNLVWTAATDINEEGKVRGLFWNLSYIRNVACIPSVWQCRFWQLFGGGWRGLWADVVFPASSPVLSSSQVKKQIHCSQYDLLG